MRRFPAPSGTAGPSTPLVVRSAEAPMQYEWEKPRQYPASPFHAASGSGAPDDGERARKRTHYEAMDVDTPPRPSYPPSSSTAPSSSLAGPSSALDPMSVEPLSFEAKDFHVPEALGLKGHEVQEVTMADNAEDLVNVDEGDHAKENMALAVRGDAGARRRKVCGKKRAEQLVETDDDAEDEAHDGGFLGTLQKKVGKSAGEFSFQVHHHHAPAAAIGPDGSAAGSTPERWLHSNTPYVLLGYLQFGALTLLALLVLSLLVLFLYTLYTDIQARLISLTLELRAEILQCAKAYVDNRCEPATRLPVLEGKCAGWEECMNREVVVVGKTRVVAETLAEVVNGFVDVISFKTMLFVVLTLGITIYGSSAALSLLSSRSSSHPPPHVSGSPGLGAPPPHFYPYPYGLPYNAGQTPWVVENGGNAEQVSLGLGAPPGGARRASS
ncbi:hypothetical protein JCM1841_007022 [Sporobolomyces salmonicolor]